LGKRVLDGAHSPTLSHQSEEFEYQPASMQNVSTPAADAASIRGSSFSVEGSPLSVFM
jgi:hypothetical protein